LKQDTDEQEDVYFWYGIDFDNMNKIFLDILEGGRVGDENNMWFIFRDFVKVMFKNRKVSLAFFLVGDRGFTCQCLHLEMLPK
jgi:hypothetical protein